MWFWRNFKHCLHRTLRNSAYDEQILSDALLTQITFINVVSVNKYVMCQYSFGKTCR